MEENPEPFPNWLVESAPEFNRNNFFGSRTLYYPGSRFDGHPIRVCSMSHAVHTFVYVDDGVSAKKIVNRLHRFQPHYYIERLQFLNEQQLVGQNNWRPPHGDLSDGNVIEPYYLHVVLCRMRNLDQTHGPQKLAILFIGRDGFETFDNLYCQNNGIRPPYLIVVEDMGICGGRFDNEGQLHNYARRYGALPELLLVGDNSIVWDGYRCTGAREPPGADGAMPNNNFRCLYEFVA